MDISIGTFFNALYIYSFKVQVMEFFFTSISEQSHSKSTNSTSNIGIVEYFDTKEKVYV